jgi:hypothetical protein
MRSSSDVAEYVESWGISSVGALAGAEGSVDDMIWVSVGDWYGRCGAGRVEKASGVGGSSWSEQVLGRNVVGVPNGDGRSGSILKFALRLVKNAAGIHQQAVSLRRNSRISCSTVVDVMQRAHQPITRPPKQKRQKYIPALVLKPGSEGIAGIAFSKPE